MALTIRGSQRGEVPSMDSSILIALLALIFAIGSAWWMYAKRGRLRGSKPPHFALLHDGIVFFIRIPLAVRNSGGRTRVVQDMRLWVPDTSQVLAIPWRRTVETLLPTPSESVRDPVPFPVRGHDAVAPVVEFGPPLPGFTLDTSRHLVRVEALLADCLKWELVLESSGPHHLDSLVSTKRGQGHPGC